MIDHFFHLLFLLHFYFIFIFVFIIVLHEHGRCMKNVLWLCDGLTWIDLTIVVIIRTFFFISLFTYYFFSWFWFCVCALPPNLLETDRESIFWDWPQYILWLTTRKWSLDTLTIHITKKMAVMPHFRKELQEKCRGITSCLEHINTISQQPIQLPCWIHVLWRNA